MARGSHLSIKFLVSTLVLLTASLCQSQLLAEKFNPTESKSFAQLVLNIGSNGGRGCLHTFREDSPGLTSHRDVVKGQRALPTKSHDLTFVVQQRNMDQLTRILHDVSDPASENYGNHMTKKEVIDLTSNPDSNNEVVAYLRAAGADITLVEHGGSSITARGPISLWERMLNTEFYSYSLPSKMIDGELQSNTNTIQAHEFVRTEKYSVPLHLDKHVAFVMNTVQLPQFRSTKVPVTKIDSVDTVKSSKFSEETVLYQGYVTPQLLNNAYGIDDNTGHPQATQAAYETGGQVFSPQDLATFQKDLKLPIRPASETIGNMTVTSKWCRENGYSICAESNLDMMYMLAMADTPTITYYSSERMSWFLVTVLYSPRPPPLVISISYTSEERYVSRGEAATLEDAVKILGVMGVTVLASAGDDGVSPVPARLDASRCGYVPLYPASCPYIVSVGATQVSDYSRLHSEQAVVSRLILEKV
jgi:tripeptidyl-peptidase I